jgi:four helix bundle protein
MTSDRKFSFRLYYVSFDAIRALAPFLREIARHDADLARQMRRAGASVHLNIAEAMDADGRNRIARLRTALGSTNECIAGLDVADAFGYIETDERAHQPLQHVRATLLRLVMPKR